MNTAAEYDRGTAESMSMQTIREINARRFFQAGERKPVNGLRPWQFVEMEYRRMGLTPPAYIPPLETMEDAEIWMCLDERVNYRMRMREASLAG
jgi:hypothetical protein